ncbi:hypothetical protein [Pararhodobacter zhoushanensis]|uniref:Lipoprotein n=1 Tax=Pararhodobacter zhoushanensis TaxID=2479545 RepID=A0ABT3H4I2_9RHOB|nr:hypothetical protein [Pararhodobacter zhoushanensis]MCW1934724.1 hypothetical protein [Pararhodobacter zhoushanensis]
MRLALALVALLAACASPDRAFWGSEEQRVTIDGRVYAVFVRSSAGESHPRVQVIRLGYARRPEHPAILIAMRQAAQQVSGCPLIEGSAEGDSGVMTARLACDAAG